MFFLTRVIALKTQKVPPSHIPFRNSTLTKLMKSSLTGNYRTLLFLCINPSLKQFDQSHSTLRFGLQSRLIENKVQQFNKYRSNKIIAIRSPKKMINLTWLFTYNRNYGNKIVLFACKRNCFRINPILKKKEILLKYQHRNKKIKIRTRNRKRILNLKFS